MSNNLTVQKWHLNSTPHNCPYMKLASDIISDIPSTYAVCELGCGAGQVLKLLDHHRTKIGVDIDNTVLSVASRLNPGAVFFNYDVINNPTSLKQVTDCLDEELYIFTAINFLHQYPPKHISALIKFLQANYPGSYLIADSYCRPESSPKNSSNKYVHLFPTLHTLHRIQADKVRDLFLFKLQ